MKNKIREMGIRNQLNEKEEIGLKVTDKKIEFIFPKHYEITSNSINEMLNLLRLIDKYKIKFPEGRIHEDISFIYRYLLHCKNLYYITRTI